MNVKISKWGNSLAVRIPSNVAQSVRLSEGVDLEIKEDGKRIVLERAQKRSYSLDKLLSKVTKKNVHQEITTERVGLEEW
jgi:antitoxin MazE